MTLSSLSKKDDSYTLVVVRWPDPKQLSTMSLDFITWLHVEFVYLQCYVPLLHYRMPS